MKLKDFIQVFCVQCPFYLRVMHSGTGSKYIIYTMQQVDSYLDLDVTALSASRHGSLGSLVQVDVNV